MYTLKRYHELVDLINHHNRNYYLFDNPTISDAEWDKLYDELLAHENELGVVLPNSPSQKVGDVVLSGFKKHTHTTPLLSLSKTNTVEGLEKWNQDIRKVVNNPTFTVECKLDGLRMTVTYNNGQLINAATRGDGLVGEDVTAQVMQINNVPKYIKYTGPITVEGEALMRLSVLEKYNKTAAEPLKNARNAAAGAIRNLDTKVIKERNLDVYFYGITKIDNQSLISTQSEVFEFLKQNGFEVFVYSKTANSFDEIVGYVNEIDKNKHSFDVLLDGAVIKLNQIAEREEVGYTSKFPKWAIAFKFEAEEVTSILNDVIWQVGRTGKITPIAEIDAVELAGATVRRATLNNYGDITRKDLKINSRVFVRRSNEVIPEVLGVSEHYSNSRDIIAPKFCPSCGGDLVEDGANLFCRNNNNCKEQIIGRLVHFANKRAMNIEGLNDKIVMLLFESGMIKNVSDLYAITKPDLLLLEGFKDKKATNLVNSINKSKQVNLNNFLYALGINGIGEKTSKDLVLHFNTLENIKNATIEELIEVNEVGEILAENIKQWFSDANNLTLIKQLKELGVSVVEQPKPVVLNTNNFFFGKTFVITGKFNAFSRDELKDKVESFGGKTSDSVSAKTHCLLKGIDGGSKYTKAVSLNVQIIEEQELLKLFDDAKI